MVCNKCRIDKPLTEYYMRNGKPHGCVCKACIRKQSREWRARTIDIRKEYDRNRKNKKERCEQQKEYKKRLREENPMKYDEIFHGLRKRYRQKHKEKTLAESKLDYALSRNKIERPNECSICHKKCIPHGHHYDYTKPLDVIWVCPACHSQIHKQMREQARQIS